MNWATCWYLIQSDAYRMTGTVGLRGVAAALWRHRPSRLLLTQRYGHWARSTDGRLIHRVLSRGLHRHYTNLCGTEIPFTVVMGPGVMILHDAGGIVVNGDARLGSGVTLAPDVIIGNNPPNPAGPTVGDEVNINVGAKVIGEIQVGDRVQIGANAVVVRDVPADSVVAGVPARVLPDSKPHLGRRLEFADALGPIPS